MERDEDGENVFVFLFWSFENFRFHIECRSHWIRLIINKTNMNLNFSFVIDIRIGENVNFIWGRSLM